MYVRFVIGRVHELSRVRLGVFQAAYQLRDSGALEPHEHDWFDHEMDWLNEHLKAPKCLREAGTERAICWFKPEAKRPISKVRGVASLLDEHGHRVHMITTRKPGTIIYEDGWQIVAYPFRSTRTNRL